MKDIVIFGAGEIAMLAAYYFREDTDRRVASFTVDASHKDTDNLLGLPVAVWEDVEQHYPPSDFEMFVALSYRDLNKFRSRKVEEAIARGYGLSSYVSSRATLFSTFQAKPNQFILEDNTVQPFATIGQNVTLWSGNHIGHHSTIADDVFIASHVVISGGVSIGPRTFIGVNVTIRDHVSIGADCVIGAGALVLRDVPDGSVMAPSGSEISKVPSYRLRKI
jgi:sugar O-acyltransferase (sialic acid O-acetyltransferase NeuD family)